MNKEVIKKYKEVFDYWLDGGKVWTKYCGIYPDGNGWQLNDREFNSKDYKYIQDNKYADLRKAQADGKVIQYLQDDTWRDVETTIVGGSEYRIKPEEPKFKVGDWVRVNDVIVQQWEYELQPSYKVELWEPQVGEYICYWSPMRKDIHGYMVAHYEPHMLTYKGLAPLEFIQTLKDK